MGLLLYEIALFATQHHTQSDLYYSQFLIFLSGIGLVGSSFSLDSCSGSGLDLCSSLLLPDKSSIPSLISCIPSSQSELQPIDITLSPSLLYSEP